MIFTVAKRAVSTFVGIALGGIATVRTAVCLSRFGNKKQTAEAQHNQKNNVR
jgi:hypothetical protein